MKEEALKLKSQAAIKKMNKIKKSQFSKNK